MKLRKIAALTSTLLAASLTGGCFCCGGGDPILYNIDSQHGGDPILYNIDHQHGGDPILYNIDSQHGGDPIFYNICNCDHK